MGIRKEMEEKEESHKKEVGEIIIGKVRYGKDSYRVIGIYVNEDTERKLEELDEWMEGKEEGMRTIIGGILMRERARREGE